MSPGFSLVGYHMSQRMTKPTIRLMQPAKTHISLHIRAVWSETSLILCAFCSLQAIQRGINENPCHTGWMYRLIWVFAGHTGLFVGFVVCWLIFYPTYSNTLSPYHTYSNIDLQANFVSKNCWMSYKPCRLIRFCIMGHLLWVYSVCWVLVLLLKKEAYCKYIKYWDR